MIDSLKVEDTFTSGTKFPGILFHERDNGDSDGKKKIQKAGRALLDSGGGFINVEFETNPLESDADVRLNVEIQQVEFVYNPLWTHKIFSFFASPDHGPNLWAKHWKEKKQSEFLEALTHHRKVDLNLEIHNPKLLVPEDCCTANTPLLVADLRSFTLKSAHNSTGFEKKKKK